MGDAGDDRIDHLSVADVRTLHAFVVENDENTEPGISDEGAIDYAVTFVADGHFGEQPETHHEKAFHLVRLLVANHPFVTGTNERRCSRQSRFTRSTATNSTTVAISNDC